MKDKHNLLIIASHFPPHSRPGGVLRIAKLVKYLPEEIWYPAILTVNGSKSIKNDKLYNEIKNKCRIYAVPSFDIRILYHYFKGAVYSFTSLFRTSNNPEKEIDVEDTPISSGFLVPDHLFLWAIFSVLRALALQIKHKINVVLVTAPSHSGLITGYLLNRLRGTKLIVDYRDPWTTSSFHIKRKWSWLNRFEDWLEGAILNVASEVVVVNKYFIKDILDKYQSLTKDKFTVISNGFDKQDFENVNPIRFKKKVLLHSGNFYYGRSPLSFFKAVQKAAHINKELFANWEIVLVGSGEEYKNVLVDLGIVDYVRLTGFVNHDDSIRYILGADALLLIPGRGLTTLTGKIFEYIGSAKPIFLLGNKSAASELLRENDLGLFCPDVSVELVTSKLIEFLSAFEAYKNKINVGANGLNLFDRRSIALKFSDMLKAYKL